MSATNSFAENVEVDLVHLGVTDIAGDPAGVWLPMTTTHKVAFFCFINQKDAAGVFDNLKVQQATDASGTGAKDLSPTVAMTVFTNFAAVGAIAILEVDVAIMDTANGFNHLTVVVGLSNETGTNTVIVVALRDPRFHSKDLNTAFASTNVISR